MEKDKERGLFGLLEDYRSYHRQQPAILPGKGRKKKGSAQRTDERQYDRGESLSLSTDYAEEIDYEPVSSYSGATAYEAPFSPSDALRYEAERFGTEVESFTDESDVPAVLPPSQPDPSQRSETTDSGPIPAEPEDPDTGPVPPELPDPDTGPIPPEPKQKTPPAPARGILNDDSFEADLRAILSGQKRPASPPPTSASPPPTSAAPPPPPPAAEEEKRNEHAIFEKIAQSMRLANAYDLGELELEQRFDAFDAEAEKKKS